MFVGLLSTFLIGAEKLSKMSVTGQASHRFSKLKNLDGTPKYPPTEGVDPKMIEFICSKFLIDLRTSHILKIDIYFR